MRGRRLAGLVLASALGLAACGARTAPPPGNPEATLAHSGSRMGLGDTDPHPWAGPDPAGLPVQGLDVSRFQGPINWQAVAGAGVRFAFINATEGGDLIDPEFRTNMRGAARAGIARGAYHFFYHCRSAAEQARFFIASVPRQAGALPPVLDIEWTPTSPTCTIRRDASVIRAEMLDFQRIVGAHYGQRPLIYTTVDFWRDNDLGQLRGEEFWLRSVAAHPSEIYPGQSWTLWQHTSTGLVPGIGTETDINAFVGSDAAWQAWLARRAP